MMTKRALTFHHRHYRYVHMMLRRYPKMRAEWFGLSSESKVRAICGNDTKPALLAYISTTAKKAAT